MYGLCGLIFALLCAATLISARPATMGMQSPERDDNYVQTTSPQHSDRNAPNDGVPQPSSGASNSNTESGDGEENPCLNVSGVSQRPPAECIRQLRHQRRNYRNILFAYAEALELEFSESTGTRRARNDEHNDCENILGELNSEAVPEHSTCPYQFSCEFHHDRYPHYSISAHCLPTGDSNPRAQCAEYGRVSLVILERHEEACADGSGVCTTHWREMNSEVTHGCQATQ